MRISKTCLVVREPRQNGRRNDGNQQDYASFSNQDNQEAEMDLGLKSDDLEAVAVLYDCIRELFKEQTPDKDHLLAEQFDDHVQHVMHDLNIKLNQRDSRNIMQTNVLKVRYDVHLIQIKVNYYRQNTPCTKLFSAK